MSDNICYRFCAVVSKSGVEGHFLRGADVVRTTMRGSTRNDLYVGILGFRHYVEPIGRFSAGAAPRGVPFVRCNLHSSAYVAAQTRVNIYV